MVLTGGASLISCIYGELNFFYLLNNNKIFCCIDNFSFFNALILFGTLNLSLGYLIFRTIEEIYILSLPADS
jgi:hypothetical protein